jgi:hypothetical protein
MVGEIRDVETAQIAIQASLTGHLVLSTLHTNDSASAITRLIDMGIEPYLLRLWPSGSCALSARTANAPARDPALREPSRKAQWSLYGMGTRSSH